MATASLALGTANRTRFPMRYERSINCSPKHPCDLWNNTLAKRHYLNIREAGSPDDLGRRLHLRADACALQKEQLAARPDQGNRERDQLRESADGARRRLVEPRRNLGILGSCTENLHIAETQCRRLTEKPIDATFHGFDEDEVNVRSCNGKNKTRQAGAAPDVSDASWFQQGSKQRAVQNMAAPQSRELEWANQPQLLTPCGQVVGESAREFDPITKKRGCRSRFFLQFRRDDGIRHANVSRETSRV